MKSPELTEFFSLLGKAKKEKKEEFDNLLKEADINLDVLTSSVVTGIKEAKVNIKKQKKKEEKLIEQLDSIIDVIENPKEVKDITEPAVTVGVPEDFDVSSLEDADDNPSFEVVDLIKPEPIKTPKISDTVAQAIKFIEETNIKEEVENADETSVDNLKAEIKQVRDILYKVLAHGPGSGEVNLLKLDDVDEDSAKVDGKVLQYQASTGKFIGGSTSGIGTQDSLNTSGIITAAQFSGFSHLIAPYASTKTITVKVADKIDGEHRYYGTGSGSGYVLDNVQSPFLTLTPGRTYRFDVSDSSNSSHPFRFYLDAAKATAYTTGVTVGSGYVDLEVTDSTPTVIHYQCSSHGYMGNAIQVNSSNAIKLNSQAASYYLDYDNFSNTPTIPSNNNQLTNGAGYITTSFTNTNQLTNGANFITASDNITGTSAGLTGTPSITINGLTAATGTFSGNVTVGGVLTYEDVTNVDSIGIVTARAGVLVGSGITLSKDGDVFATGITSSTKVHVGVDTGVYDEDLVVTGNARVTGILTIGTGSIVLDPTAKQLRGLEEIVIGIANTITIKQDSKGEIEFTDAVGTPKSVGIGTTVSINTSGIITATTFVGGFTGDLTGTAQNATNAVTLADQAASHYLNYNNFTNTPTIPSNNNQLTNGAGFITGSSLNASNLSSGTIPDARFPSTLPAIDGSALTGVASTDNIRTNTNATFLQNVNVSGTTTATTFIGNLTGNVTGNVSGTSGSTTGNAATATKLANARTIGGVSFDGSANIDLPGVNSDGNQDTTGNSATSTLAVSAQGLTGSPNITVTDVNAVDAIISGNLSVAGTITSLDQNDILATGIITASSGVDLGDPGIVTLSSDTLTTTSTSADTIASVSATVNRSATFQVQVTRGTQYHMTTINVIHNGTVAFMSEYGTIRTGAVLATFDADISGGNLRLRATPTSTDSTVFKLSKTVIKV